MAWGGPHPIGRTRQHPSRVSNSLSAITDCHWQESCVHHYSHALGQPKVLHLCGRFHRGWPSMAIQRQKHAARRHATPRWCWTVAALGLPCWYDCCVACRTELGVSAASVKALFCPCVVQVRPADCMLKNLEDMPTAYVTNTMFALGVIQAADKRELLQPAMC